MCGPQNPLPLAGEKGPSRRLGGEGLYRGLSKTLTSRRQGGGPLLSREKRERAWIVASAWQHDAEGRIA